MAVMVTISPPRKIVFVGHIVSDETWKEAKRHNHTFHELLAMRGGKLTVDVPGQKLEAGAGDVVFYSSGTPHEESVKKDATVDLLYAGFESGPVTLPIILRDADGRIRQLLLWMVDEIDSAYSGKDRLMLFLLRTALLECEKAAIYRVDRFVQRVRFYLKDHLAEQVTLDEIARHVGLSRAHFSRRYHEATGMAPMADLRRIRLEAVQNLLITTDLPQREIATRTGFTDEHHLAHTFKHFVRVPPGYFRQRKRS